MSQFRMLSSVQGNAVNDMKYLCETPLSDAEIASNLAPHSFGITIPAGNEIHVNLAVTRASLYNITDILNSNPLFVSISNLPCAYNTSFDAACNIEIELQNFREVEFSNTSSFPLSYITACDANNVFTKQLYCNPYFNATVNCSGTEGVWFTQCPALREVPACHQVG